MRSLISFQDVPLSAIDVPGSSFFWREEKGRRCVQAGPHAAWPQLFEERAVVSGRREVRAQDEPQVAWPQEGAAARAATAESGRRAVRAQAGRVQFPWPQDGDARATAAPSRRFTDTSQVKSLVFQHAVSSTYNLVVVCYCTPTLGTSSAHSTLSRLVVHLEPKKESVWSEESHPSSSERRQAAAARRRPIRRGW